MPCHCALTAFAIATRVGPLGSFDAPPTQWRVKRVTLNGEDVTDGGFDVAANVALGGLVVEMTTRASEITGIVTDETREADRDASVIAFARDPLRWRTPTRYVVQTRMGTGERYHLRLPAGDIRRRRRVARERRVAGSRRALATARQRGNDFDSRRREEAARLESDSAAVLRVVMLRALPLVTLALLPGAVWGQVIQPPSAQQVAPPSAAATSKPTAVVRGHVYAADSGLPLRGAPVRIATVEGGTAAGDSRLAYTDVNGAYEFTELPSGRYNLTAMKGAYVTLSYGQTRPFEPGQTLGDRRRADRRTRGLQLRAAASSRAGFSTNTANL